MSKLRAAVGKYDNGCHHLAVPGVGCGNYGALSNTGMALDHWKSSISAEEIVSPPRMMTSYDSVGDREAPVLVKVAQIPAPEPSVGGERFAIQVRILISDELVEVPAR